MADQAVQMAEILVDEIGLQANLDPLEENKEEFKCHECGVRVLYEKSLKRHMRDQHGGKPKMYMKNLKVNGKYICQFCTKEYSHTRDLRAHYKKYHI